MRRLTWDETRDYWETLSANWAAKGRDDDPEGLENVIHPGAPRWLNEYRAKEQHAVYTMLLGSLSEPKAGERALDVGCGGGRWCRLLAARGFDTTGIDLQPDLIEANAARDPHIRYHRSPIQDFQPDGLFDLLSSVTVIQHNPPDEQRRILEQVRSLANAGAHFIMLENVRDQSAHVWAHPIDEWAAMAADAGFHLVCVRRYDYNPLLALRGLARRQIGKVLHWDRQVSPSQMANVGRGARAAEGSPAKRIYHLATHAAVRADGLIDPQLVRRNWHLPCGHAAFLFQAS